MKDSFYKFLYRVLRKIALSNILLCMLVGVYSCDDLLIEDISDETLVIYLPCKNCTLTSMNTQLWWSEIDDASSYQVQVVSPNFENAEELIKDTVVNANKIKLTFPVGKYQWRVRATNSYFETGYFYSSFTVDTTSYPN